MERQLIEMQDPLFGPGVSRAARVPITVYPAGLVCAAEMFLGVTDTSPAATSGKISFTSTGASQSIRLPVVMPTSYGVYHVYLDVYADGIRMLSYQATEDVIVPGGTVGPVTWE